MNRLRISIFLALAAFILIVAWCSPSKKTPPDPPPPSQPVIESPSSATPVQPAISPPPRREESRTASRRDFANPLVASSFEEIPPPTYAAQDSAAAADFDQIAIMFRDFRTVFGENPVGTNAEIMKAIMGGNPKSAVLGPPSGQHINGNGELLDHWGTPYFFHQLSKDVMEIRSAGADLRLWTRDDIVGK